MKRLFAIAVLVISSLVLSDARAQVRMGLGLRLGSENLSNPPLVAPRSTLGYSQTVPGGNLHNRVYNQSQLLYGQTQLVRGANDDYYYLPDVDSYYDVSAHAYYYFDGKNWVSSQRLPGIYQNFDLTKATKYEIKEASPYLYDDYYKSKYYGHAVGQWDRK